VFASRLRPITKANLIVMKKAHSINVLKYVSIVGFFHALIFTSVIGLHFVGKKGYDFRVNGRSLLCKGERIGCLMFISCNVAMIATILAMP